jgi:hypothetical protein
VKSAHYNHALDAFDLRQRVSDHLARYGVIGIDGAWRVPTKNGIMVVTVPSKASISLQIEVSKARSWRIPGWAMFNENTGTLELYAHLPPAKSAELGDIISALAHLERSFVSGIEAVIEREPELRLSLTRAEMQRVLDAVVGAALLPESILAKIRTALGE